MMYSFFGIFSSLFFPQITEAVPPPEFIVQITSQIVPIFGWIFATFVTVFAVSFQFIRKMITNKYIVIIISILVIFSVSLSIAYFADHNLRQKQLQEVSEQISLQEQAYEQRLEEKNNFELQQADATNTFIRTYYKHIADGQLAQAYEMTDKSIDYEAFVALERNITNIRIEKVEKMDQQNYSLRIVEIEGLQETTYGILATIAFDETDAPKSLAFSDIVVLGTGTTEVMSPSTFVVDNQKFKNLTKGTSTVFVLDAREKIEYEYGRYPGSIHIKYADLEEGGRWAELPQDKPVYVFCWSGIRGSMVASYLRSKNIDAYYLKEGAKGWVEGGGTWEGESSFGAVYEEERYSKLFSSKQVASLRQEGVVLIDSREPATAKAKPIAGSIPLRIMYTPTSQMDTILSTVPPQSKVITVCDDYVNCFDARLAGIELERRGNVFLGRTLSTGNGSL